MIDRASAQKIIALAGPIALTSATEQFLGIVDTAVVGRLGTQSLAAVSVAGGVLIVPLTLVIALLMGLRILAGRKIGEGDYSGYGRLVRSATLPSLVAAIAFIPLAAATMHPLMSFLLRTGADSSVASTYAMIRICALPVTTITTAVTIAFACAGNTKLMLRVLIVSNLVHLPLAAILGLGWVTGHSFGAAGAALSSVLADLVGCAYALLLTTARPGLSLISSLSIDLRITLAAFRLGWPEAVNLCALVAVEPCTIALLVPSGAVVVAAYRALAIVNDTCNVVSFSIADASQILISHAVGAGLDIRNTFRTGVSVAVALGFAVAIAIAPIAYPVVLALTGVWAVAVVAAIPTALHIAATQPIKSYAVGLEARLYAEGATGFIMVVGLLAAAIGLSIVFVAVHCGTGLFAVPFAWIVAWSLRALALQLWVNADDRRKRFVGHAVAPVGTNLVQV